MNSSGAQTLLLLIGIGLAAAVVYSVSQGGKNGPSVGSQIGAGIANEVNDAIAAASNSAWNGSGSGPFDSWSNLANFLTGNCTSAGNCSGGS